ncbi:hypothetical protein D9619_005100 [Psilocybe cf. subviscida]|uniref:Uncharacterized protein n=1 Tax=Psilocybe cf. subviscida TaxID=2480587 RepID=A0A8H5BP06_9AGAR|nr:hypothetical protein D9619_005100 [Psilocybe cf. subviscida]
MATGPARQIGNVTAVFMIFNQMIGTGVFATSTMLGFSSSVGFALVIWVVGALFALCGIIWGTALPHNGGEKKYLEHLFLIPSRLISSVYAGNEVLLAYAAGNALVPSSSVFSPVRIVAFLCLTGVILLHGLHIQSGLRLQNAPGFLKLRILLIIVGAGFIVLSGSLQGIPLPGDLDSWVMWSFVGYSNEGPRADTAHCRPARHHHCGSVSCAVQHRVFRRRGPASKEQVTGSGRLVAALLFRNIWGATTERVLNVFVALSALGNVLSVLFSQGRVNRSSERCKSFLSVTSGRLTGQQKHPSPGWHFTGPSVCSGDAYNFVINIDSYPFAVINATISMGLLYLALRNHPFFARGEKPLQQSSLLSYITSTTPYDSHRNRVHIPDPDTLLQTRTGYYPFAATLSLIILTTIFAAFTVFLFVLPLTKRQPGVEPYKRLPYWTHAAGGWAIFALGALWWVYRARKIRKIRDGW